MHNEMRKTHLIVLWGCVMTMPPDAHLGEWSTMQEATRVLSALVKERREVPLSDVEAVARKYRIDPTRLIRSLEVFGDCRADYAAGVVRCQ